MSVIHYLILLAVLSTGVAYLLLSYGLHKAKANTAAIISFITLPISAIFFAYLIIGERFPWTTVLGGTVLIIAGLIALWKFDIKKFFALH